MDFTPKIGVKRSLYGMLAMAVVGFMAWVSEPAPTQIAATHDTLALHESYQTSNAMLVMPAAERPIGYLRSANSEYYQPISHWYNNKHWWKRNAPIIGGAGGGALIGGLAGGGTGALVGGAIGGGSGYAYKHYRSHHHH
jgi:hypothetical protein